MRTRLLLAVGLLMVISCEPFEGAATRTTTSDGGRTEDGGDAGIETPLPQLDAGDALYVFVTSGRYSGKISDENEEGASKADEVCRGLADTSPVRVLNGRRWAAWLSTRDKSAGERVTKGPLTAVYRMPNSTATVFAPGDNLRSLAAGTDIASPRTPITITETGETMREKGFVWTGTTRTGDATADCSGWRSSDADISGKLGVANAANFEWTATTDATAPDACNQQHHLYCFELPN